MSFNLDDAWDNSREVMEAGTAAFGLYCRVGSWVARNLTDGFVPTAIATSYGSPEWTSRLLRSGLWVAVEGGYTMPHYLILNPSAETVRARRRSAARRQALVRDPALRQAVRSRDGDRCRYCGVAVRWQDRKGGHGGTYDHVDPDGPNSFENLVVCCRACNAAKRNRTPEAAGMTLRPAPTYLDTTQVGSESDPGSSRPHTSPLKGGSRGAPPKRGARAPSPGDRPLMTALPGGVRQGLCPAHLFELPCRSCAGEAKATATCDLHPYPLPCPVCAAAEQTGTGSG